MPFLHPCPVPSAECDKLRRDGCRSSQYYSQGPTFAAPSSPLCDEDQDEDEEADQKVRLLLCSTQDPGLDPRTEKGYKWGNSWSQNKARFGFFLDFLVLTSVPWGFNTPTPGKLGEGSTRNSHSLWPSPPFTVSRCDAEASRMGSRQRSLWGTRHIPLSFLSVFFNRATLSPGV